MEYLKSFVDFFLHLDKHLAEVINQYGAGTYAILFAIVFCETGLVILPLLPGDSLLFAAGTFAALGSLDLVKLIVLLLVAAILGDAVNYHVGKFLGPKVLRGDSRIFKKEYLDKTERFYRKYGSKTIVIARFVPIVRTFAPFLAGVGSMSYSTFVTYNIAGAVLWVVSLTLAGYFFGTIPVVQKNFTLVIFAIIFISILPGIIEAYRARREQPA